MTLPEAIQLVNQKLQDEQKGEAGGETADRYATAFEDYPVVMEIATQFVADAFIQSQYEARKQQAAAAQASGDGGTAPPIQA